VVVIDVFRASSAICTALHQGIHEIIPVRDIEDAIEYKAKGFITAAERKGEVVEGFDFGNSPFAFMEPSLKGKSIVLTTSNCTAAIHEIKKNAAMILVGAFANISVLTEFLTEQNRSILLLCAGWKNRYSLEDSLFAGALTQKLIESGRVRMNCDSAFASQNLYSMAKDNMREFLMNSSHSHRLHHLQIENDILYCLQQDTAPVVPFFNGYSIKPLTAAVESSVRKKNTALKG
jgi:2-phosphosulfolactate phosphatase